MGNRYFYHNAKVFFMKFGSWAKGGYVLLTLYSDSIFEFHPFTARFKKSFSGFMSLK